MDSMINVGNKITKNDITVKAATDGIIAILDAGAKNHTEQDTIKHALTTLAEIPAVKNVSISNNTLTSGKTDLESNYSEDEDSEDEV